MFKLNVSLKQLKVIECCNKRETGIMKRIIEKYDSRFVKDEMNCPLCDSKLLIEDEIRTIMDGNTVYQCTKEKFHRFWINPRSSHLICYNHEANQENFNSLIAWDIKTGQIIINSESFTNYIKLMQEDINFFRINLKKQLNLKKFVS